MCHPARLRRGCSKNVFGTSPLTPSAPRVVSCPLVAPFLGDRVTFGRYPQGSTVGIAVMIGGCDVLMIFSSRN